MTVPLLAVLFSLVPALNLLFALLDTSSLDGMVKILCSPWPHASLDSRSEICPWAMVPAFLTLSIQTWTSFRLEDNLSKALVILKPVGIRTQHFEGAVNMV